MDSWRNDVGGWTKDVYSWRKEVDGWRKDVDGWMKAIGDWRGRVDGKFDTFKFAILALQKDVHNIKAFLPTLHTKQ